VGHRFDESGGAIEVNRPSGGTQRFDANALGVFAQPLATPEPGTPGFVDPSLLGLIFVARRVSRFGSRGYPRPRTL